MDFFPLHLFPERALDASVVTTVWVGVVIGALLNLRFGWLLTGLIVPGYLVPLLIQKPVVVGVVLFEAILAYGLVWLMSERMPRLGLWSNSFGMDRFFAVILSAVFVRVVVDGALLPVLGEWLNHAFNLNFDYRSNLQSYGLTMIALMAYGFVRSGLERGLITLSIHLFLTWMVVYLVLMKFTNFNLAGLSFIYEEVASSVLSSPKTYIIMIVTAIVASRMNLFYGWDFNGILVPAFIAMQWSEPARILATFAEAFAVLLACRALLRLPVFQRRTMEKGRQIILFFTVSFLYKTALGYLIPFLFPEARITDYFGFGYVLCSLIAMRIHSKGIGVKLTNCTLQTSFAAVLIASGAGFALAQAKVNIPWLAASSAPLPSPGPSTLPEVPAGGDLDAEFEALRVGMYAVRTNQLFLQPLPGDLERFKEAARLLLKAGPGEGPEAGKARELLAGMDFELRWVENRFWLIRERALRRGWGFFVLDPAAPNRLNLEAPAPMEERGSCSGAYRLFRLLHARSLASATNLRRPGRESNLDPLLSPRTFLAVWHQVVGSSSTLQVRGTEAGGASRLLVKRELPEGLDLSKLEGKVGGLGTRWAPSPETNVLASLSWTRFAELALPPQTFLRLEPSATEGSQGVDLEPRTLASLLRETLEAVAPEGSERFVPPRVDELLFLDEEVLTPLHALLVRTPGFDPRSTQGRQILAPLAASAALHGYALRVVADPATRSAYVALSELPSSPRRWGTFLYRAGPAANLVVQVPRPGLERGALEFGHWVFEGMQARLLNISGTLPLTRRDLSADVNRVARNGNLFALATQVHLRESRSEPGLVLQVRSVSNRADVPFRRVPDADLLLWHAAQGKARTVSEPFGRLLASQGFHVQRMEGQEESAGLRAEIMPVARYLRATENKSLMAAWIAPSVERSFRGLHEDLSLSQQLKTSGLPPTEENLAECLSCDPRGEALPSAFVSELDDYLNRQDVLLLERLSARWNHLGLRCQVDRASGRPFLVAGTPGSPALVASLDPGPASGSAWQAVGPALTFQEARRLLGARTVRILRGGTS